MIINAKKVWLATLKNFPMSILWRSGIFSLNSAMLVCGETLWMRVHTTVIVPFHSIIIFAMLVLVVSMLWMGASVTQWVAIGGIFSLHSAMLVFGWLVWDVVLSNVGETLWMGGSVTQWVAIGGSFRGWGEDRMTKADICWEMCTLHLLEDIRRRKGDIVLISGASEDIRWRNVWKLLYLVLANLKTYW